MSKLTRNQLGITDAHTHAGGIDFYNLIKTRHPMTQSVRDLVLKAKIQHIDNLIVFPMPMALYFDPVQLVKNQRWEPSGLEDFPYQLSNKALLYEANAFARGTVLPFMAIDPKNKVDEQAMFVDTLAAQGQIYGLKLHTRATGSTPEDLAISPFLHLLKKFNLPILIHSGL